MDNLISNLGKLGKNPVQLVVQSGFLFCSMRNVSQKFSSIKMKVGCHQNSSRLGKM